MKNFDQCKRSGLTYPGTFWDYLGILYEGVPYILKFRSKEAFGDSVRLPVSEYVGDRIYEMFGVPSQTSILGTWHGRVAVACKDFRKAQGEDFDEIPFMMMKLGWIPDPKDIAAEYLRPKDMHLTGILKILDEHPWLKRHPEMKTRFWEMFIIDALLGNPDRCTASWGILSSISDEETLTPVFGNGTCLNAGMKDAEMEYALRNPEEFANEICLHATCSYLDENDSAIEPFSYLRNTDDADCIREAKRLIPMIAEKQEDILTLIKTVPKMSDLHRRFHENAIAVRIQNGLLPLLAGREWW